jgi:hypothetical protein
MKVSSFSLNLGNNTDNASIVMNRNNINEMRLKIDILCEKNLIPIDENNIAE